VEVFTHASFLVVDDEPLVLRSLTRVLARFGTVFTASGVEDARVQLLERPRWSGFVFDQCLTDGSGLDLLHLARERYPLAPAILLSGTMAPPVINRAFALGARCLCKPWPPQFLENFANEAAVAETEVPRRITQAVSALAVRHSLTPAQTEILLAAVSGIDRSATAAARKVSENTHKTQVRGILRKTRTLSLGELRDRVLRSVAGAA
jgi:DNA-binding NarL/FixJ family response regulator